MAAQKTFLKKMLDRLCISLLNGPGLSCRPHHSRQRMDLSTLAHLQDPLLSSLLPTLLGSERKVKIFAKVPPPKRMVESPSLLEIFSTENEEKDLGVQAYQKQQSIFFKLKTIVEEARTYIQDTGVHPLFLGFPLLSIPSETLRNTSASRRRILAPVTLIPIRLEINQGIKPSIQLFSHGEGADLVIPNPALLTFFEQQFQTPPVDIFADEEGKDPWREIREWVDYVCTTLNLEAPAWKGLLLSQETRPDSSSADATRVPTFPLEPVPSTEDLQPTAHLLPSAVLGLFPMANQNLIRDLEAMIRDEKLSGPVTAFIKAGESLDETFSSLPKEASSPGKTLDFSFEQELLVTAADPFQAEAVRLANKHAGLIIHGPPGTGKSQTIVNIIGDHLARGKRVLLVCDKRSALDVVAHRLNRLGLQDLYALVHDPERDRGDLYKKLRDQLDALPEVRTNPDAEAQCRKMNQELKKVHTELATYGWALNRPLNQQKSNLHELIGHWYQGKQELSPSDITKPPFPLKNLLPFDLLDTHFSEIQEIFNRAERCHFYRNPWRNALGVSLLNWMERPTAIVGQTLSQTLSLAQTADETLVPKMLPFCQELDFQYQAEKNLQFADFLETSMKVLPLEFRKSCLSQGEDSIRNTKEVLDRLVPFVETLQSELLDPKLLSQIEGRLPSLGQIETQIEGLAAYLRICSRFYQSLCFGIKSRARIVLQSLGLPLEQTHAEKAHRFLQALRIRLLLDQGHRQILTLPKANGLTSDDSLLRMQKALHHFVLFLTDFTKEAGLVPQALDLNAVLSLAEADPELVFALRKSKFRAQAIETLRIHLKETNLFSPEWQSERIKELAQAKPVLPTIQLLLEYLPEAENILRVQSSLLALPLPLRETMSDILLLGLPAQQGLLTLRDAVLDQNIRRHIQAHPYLYEWDDPRLTQNFERLSDLLSQKPSLLCAAILHRWKTHQKQRLLSSTGTRLSSLATELRRRLLLRGERSLRMRQVIYGGQDIPDGDPLFDLCPVWMVSPETVAQVFPRFPLFETVIFDEASQCRLEEALPVMLRAQKVVIAGDPKQLPPTRFFESAVTATQEEEPDTDQELFEKQQGEIEDLLSAALNLEIEQSYLDVHYRSRNDALIKFSNRHFYESRLQSLPSHPGQQSFRDAIRLIHVNGVYEKQCNPIEANHVCTLVKELLSQDSPPSIGIACFNLAQRNLILAQLEQAATQDLDFANRLKEARSRQGAGSFEGLFVKNLENIQGDERDHLIISTTYGPDSKGRFYKRFGPLGQTGGGRRLNVLITRAKEVIHLVTSIPKTAYQNLPALPPQEQPSGVYLLFAYLRYAESLSQAKIHHKNENLIAHQAQKFEGHHSKISSFALGLAHHLLASHRQESLVFWGNDGFCIDLALPPTTRCDEWVGVLCDGTRFTKAPDPVLWEAFRHKVLVGQGWKLKRIWTPHFFRDVTQQLQTLFENSRTETHSKPNLLGKNGPSSAHDSSR